MGLFIGSSKCMASCVADQGHLQGGHSEEACLPFKYYTHQLPLGPIRSPGREKPPLRSLRNKKAMFNTKIDKTIQNG